jgi:hypothetical protein
MRLSPAARRLAVASLLAAGVVIGAGVWRLKQFVDEDPRLCATCHRSSPEFAIWTGGSHRAVACQKCHHSSPEQGVAMLGAFVAGKKPGGKHADVEIGACASCHLSHDVRWPQVGGSRGHRVHVDEQKIACVRCHATSVHGFEPVSSTCVSCHGEHGVALSGMERLHCFACHEFLTDEAGLRPTRHDCMRCHSAQGIHAPVGDHGAMGEMACASCHRPHAKDGKSLAACADCHDHLEEGGLHARRGHARCLDCHHPHEWEASASECARCHAREAGPGHAGGRADGRPCLECHVFRGVPHPPAPAQPGAAPVRESGPQPP